MKIITKTLNKKVFEKNKVLEKRTHANEKIVQTKIKMNKTKQKKMGE